MIRVKRVYDSPSREDGYRLLVDRLWPRGLRKQALQSDGWFKDVAPSDRLRRWFKHDPKKWEEFCRRYYAELDRNPQTWQSILESARAGDVTLLYSAKDPEHNNAIALRDYLTMRMNER